VRGDWRAELTGTWLDPRNRTAGTANAGNLLPRRARLSGRLELARAWSQATLALRLIGAGPRYEDLANTLPLGGYATLDVLGAWVLSPHWSLQAKLANVTDHRYELALYYPQDRRNYFLTLRYAPQPSHP
jgi:vitamin B12 transporter